MTLSLYNVVFVLGLICLFCAAIGKPSTPVQLGWLGVFMLALAVLLR